MDIEEYIDKIVQNGKIEDMERLSEMLEDTMDIIKSYDERCYNEYALELYELAYGKNLNKEMAEKIVSKMRPYGKRWSIEETKQMQEQRGINNVSPIDFFVVINSAFNDYQNIFGDNIEDYIRFTMDFIKDEDAKQDKVYTYFTTITI